jgi:hypothetical protein
MCGSHTPPPPTASGTTCRHRWRQEIGGSKTASSLFSFYVGSEFFVVTCKQKKSQTCTICFWIKLCILVNPINFMYDLPTRILHMSGGFFVSKRTAFFFYLTHCHTVSPAPQKNWKGKPPAYCTSTCIYNKLKGKTFIVLFINCYSYSFIVLFAYYYYYLLCFCFCCLRTIW